MRHVIKDKWIGACVLRQLNDMYGSFLAACVLLRELSLFHVEFRLRFANIVSYKIILISSLFSFLVLFNPAVQVRTAAAL